jgi:FdhD protein
MRERGTTILPELRTIELAVRRIGLADPGDSELRRSIAIEMPVSIEICGIGSAVMMATPSDLRDYALGFALSEGMIERIDQILSVDVHAVEGGMVARIALPAEHADRAFDRARLRVTESSCGICGMENIAQVLRPLPEVKARIATDRGAIARALAALHDHQPLGQATGAVHAAAFCTPDGAILRAREDVGRHNALDKLIGALAGEGIDPGTGFILLTARCSYELVEKTVRAGCPVLVTISAPTSLAVERAAKAGLTLVALARPDAALVVCDRHGNIG